MARSNRLRGARPFLFHDTIRANLKWARPDASEDEMLAALRQASAFDFVAGLKNRLDTVVGDRGMMVSQGERQRLALARAFLRRPSMLILDEATNSLDSENEGRVLDAIESRRGELTVVLIAHRLSTIRRADLIYVVEGGKVVESGDWSSLSTKRDGRFRALWEAQSLLFRRTPVLFPLCHSERRVCEGEESRLRKQRARNTSSRKKAMCRYSRSQLQSKQRTGILRRSRLSDRHEEKAMTDRHNSAITSSILI